MRFLRTFSLILKKYSLSILYIWIFILTILYSTLSILRHNHFESGGFDLGIFDQAVWQYSRFLWPYNTIKERFILGDHLTLTLPVLAPLYWIWNDVRMLLVFQAFWLSFSSLAVYKIARVRFASSFTKFQRPRLVGEWTAVMVAAAYSLFYGIQYAIFFDFHPVVFAAGLVPWLLYFVETKRVILTIVTTALLLLTQENMGIALIGIGILYILRKPYRKLTILFVLLGVVYSLAAPKIISLFSPSGFTYWPPGNFNLISVFVAFFDAPEKRETWLYTLSSFAFLPLLSLGAMVAIVVDLAQYFVTGAWSAPYWSPLTHHRVMLASFVAVGAIDGLLFIKNKLRKINLSVLTIVKINKPIFSIIPIILLISAMAQQYVFHFPLNKLVKADYWKEEQWMRDDRALIALVPKDASVATQQNFVPHLSHRKEIYLIYPKLHDYDDKRCGQRSCWWLDFAGRPQYLVVDLRPDQWLTQILETNEHFDSAVANMEKSGKIRLENHVGGAKLYSTVY